MAFDLKHFQRGGLIIGRNQHLPLVSQTLDWGIISGVVTSLFGVLTYQYRGLSGEVSLDAFSV